LPKSYENHFIIFIVLSVGTTAIFEKKVCHITY